MGKQFFDQYSLLHFSSGVVAYHWGVPPLYWFLAHASFEFAENTGPGIRFINQIPFWPGGKPRADTLVNMLGDHASAMAGWYAASLLEKHLQ